MWASCLAVFGLYSPTFADINWGTAATAKYEYNSNIFDLPTGYTAPGVTEAKRDDWYQAYGATLQVNDLWGPQKFYATLTGKDYLYDFFKYLNHTEYSLDVGLNWKSGGQLDGKFDVVRSRTMVAFADLTQTELSLQTEEKETAQIGYLFTPDWRIQGIGFYHTLSEPLVQAPNLQLTEGSGQLALQYLGRAGLVAGISGTYLKGSYVGGIASDYPDYTQSSLQFTATYQPTGTSTIVGEAGYSRRTSPSILNDSSGPTGKITYKNQLTPKTSVNVGLERVINTYITNGGSEFDTSAVAGVTWEATYKLSVNAGYTYTYRFLPNQGNFPGTNRLDHWQTFTLKLDYQPLRWLWIEPYANVQKRTSDFIGGAYDASVYGVQFSVLWHCPTNRCM
ncbi:MAG: hypothetical protein ACLPTF_11825 [Steroidobacteraceae bacterium]